MAVVRTKLVPIGNSQGIRIPKALLEAAGLGRDVELEARDGELVVRAVGHPRAGWEEAAAAMAAAGDDALLDPEVHAPTRWEREEWEWR
jgi:antitoxin MazE